MPDLFEIIYKNSSANDLKRLISLRAFLQDEQDCPWILLDDFNNNEKSIEFIVNNSVDFFLTLNIKNIAKLNLKPIDIILIPKNKRFKYIELIEEIILSYLEPNNFLIDKLRSNPFNKDSLYEFLSKNNYIKSKYYSLIKKRNNDLIKLLSMSKFDINTNYNCSIFSKELKIKNYWKYLWSNTDSYDENSIIDKVIL